jgi:endoglucanase
MRPPSGSSATGRAALSLITTLAILVAMSSTAAISPLAAYAQSSTTQTSTPQVSTAQPLTAPGGFVHRSGTTLVDGTGARVTLRGVNLGNWLTQENWLMGSGQTNVGQTKMYSRLGSLVGQTAANTFLSAVQSSYVTKIDIDAIAALGFNVVRVPFNYRILEDDASPGVYKASGWAFLDNVMEWAEADGIYVVLDMHGAPGAQSALWHADPSNGAALWTNTADQDRTVALWTAIASRYAMRTAVAGYDLLNEPAAPSNTQLTDLYQRIINGIRTVDTHHLVLLEGAYYATNNQIFASRYDENEALSIHQYLWGAVTPELNIISAERNAARLNVPVWVGEFGDDSPTNVANRVHRYNGDAKLSGWCDWTWKGALQSNGRRQVEEFIPTAAWRKTVTWMAGNIFTPKPTVAEAQQGMADYLGLITTATPNQAVISALTGS